MWNNFGNSFLPPSIDYCLVPTLPLVVQLKSDCLVLTWRRKCKSQWWWCCYFASGDHLCFGVEMGADDAAGRPRRSWCKSESKTTSSGLKRDSTCTSFPSPSLCNSNYFNHIFLLPLSGLTSVREKGNIFRSNSNDWQFFVSRRFVADFINPRIHSIPWF